MEPWQIELREGFRDIPSLLNFLDIPLNLEILEEPLQFPLRVPRSLAERMQKGNTRDPLLLQVLPTLQENLITPELRKDSVGDLKALKNKGVIQKYHGRVLLIMTGACAVHCRYCFRRHFPYHEQLLSPDSKAEALRFMANDTTIEEVIFSGGDPLLLTDAALTEWANELRSITHIKRWRIHTRLPSVLPSRINTKLIQALNTFQDQQRQTIVVTHINHSNEINNEVSQALILMREAHLTLLNQSVLLRDINDNAGTLKSLSELLFQNGVLPYYLHLLDRTQGTLHFEVNEQQSLKIYHELSSRLPGYLVPRLVREVEGEPHKILMGHANSPTVKFATPQT